MSKEKVSKINLNAMESEQRAQVSGIRQLLGKEKSNVPPELFVECDHESDGFIYEDTDTYKLLFCSKCLTHYNETK